MKKILFISLMTGLFLAVTACGPKDETKKVDGKLTDTPTDTELPSFFIQNTLRSSVTVKTACGSSVVHNTGETSKGRCVAVLKEDAFNKEEFEISVQWSEGEEGVRVLCGPGEGNEACKLQTQTVSVGQDAEGNNAPVLTEGSIFAGCTIIHCAEAEEEEEEEGEEAAGDGEEAAGDGEEAAGDGEEAADGGDGNNNG